MFQPKFDAPPRSSLIWNDPLSSPVLRWQPDPKRQASACRHNNVSRRARADREDDRRSRALRRRVTLRFGDYHDHSWARRDPGWPFPTSDNRVRCALPPREESSRSGECPDRGRTSERCRPRAAKVTARWTAQLLQACSVIDRSLLQLGAGTERDIFCQCWHVQQGAGPLRRCILHVLVPLS